MAILVQFDRSRLAACVSAFLLFAAHAAHAQDGKVLAISPALCNDMKVRNVMRPISPLSCERLRLVTFPYVGFDGQVHSDGEIVVMDAAADYVLQIFTTLRDMRFPIAKARLMNHYNGNDSAATADNNTSSFNARASVGGTSLSMHAYGLAIDLNPVRNPFVTFRSDSSRNYAPAPGAAYANRNIDRAKQLRTGMAEAVIDVFADQGFAVWGGNWRNPIDYQHFQIYRPMAERLAAMSSAQALAAFRNSVERYRTCRKIAAPDAPRSQCVPER